MQPRQIAPRAPNSTFFIMLCLGLCALLSLALITQASLKYSLPILAAFVFLSIVYRASQNALEGRENTNHNKELNQKDALYMPVSHMVDLVPLAAALIDKRNRISHANSHAQKLIGIENKNQPLTNYIRDPKLTTHLNHALKGHKPEPLMTKIETPSERYIRLIFSKAHPLEDGSSQSLTLVIFDDVTDMQLNQKLRADFLANASHELKTPIASLMGYIETLQTHAKNDPEARETFLGIMYSQAERMQRLLNDLLSLRQIEQVEHIAPTGTADLNTAIRAAIDSVAPISQKHDVKIKYTKTADNTKFRGKQDEAVQMCLNLLSNAVKISAPQSTVHVTLTQRDNWNATRAAEAFSGSKLGENAYQRHIISAASSALPCLELRVSDRGPGFDRVHIPRIGERFYRVVGDLSSKEKGTGLGLAIVKHIVKRHRGGFYVRSLAGKGTEFTIIMMQPPANSHEDDDPEI